MAGPAGKGYGLDINGEAISEVAEKAKKEGLHNISLKTGSAEGNILCESCADIVFFGICLHDFNDHGQVLLNAKKMLKPAGILADLDWKKMAMEIGPPENIRFSEEKAKGLIEAA